MGNKNRENPIDAVILWVDGNDEGHRQKRLEYLEDKSIINSKDYVTRFNQVEEIKFAIDSILKNASFVRKIFLITDNQKPSFLKQQPISLKYAKVELVNHSTIFKGYEKYLPTFNSMPIETMMFNVPNLSEHFIYFNDDFFIIKKTKPTDFFIEGKPILRGKWSKFYEDIWYKKNKAKKQVFGYKLGQQNIAKELGFKKYFKFHHTPAPLRKSTFQNFFEQNPDLLLKNIKHRFRHIEQFTLQGLAYHLEIQQKHCILKDSYQLGYLQSYKKPLLWYKLMLAYFTKNNNMLFLCMQSLDLCSKPKLDYILKWLHKQFN